MTNKLRLKLLILGVLILSALFSSPVFSAKGGNKAQPIIITEVLVRDSLGKDEPGCINTSTSRPNEIIEISGENFPDWASEEADPAVLLGNYPNPLVICGLTSDTILAVCPTFVRPDLGIGRFECDDEGDFLLTVYTDHSEANYDLTIGAVGPEGPPGLAGPPGPAGPDSSEEIMIELCNLYSLTEKQPPPLCFDCGNGTLEALEQCDDGNTDGGDGCSAVCEAEVCGDGKLDVGEECDDGNTVDGDGCDAMCLVEVVDCIVPVISSVEPSTLIDNGEPQGLVISGSNFTFDTRVFIGGVEDTSPIFISETQLDAIFQPSGTGEDIGSHNVRVENGPTCDDELVDALQVISP